jgi:dipeptidyl aminopeptidase/acylaminoacyl peptidase
MRRVAVMLAALLAAPSAGAQVANLAPNENLVIDGIPPIPTSVVEAVGRYTESRAASLQSWHPTRREMLILTRFGNTNQVHAVKMPGGDRGQLTFFPDRVQGASYEPTEGSYFVFSKDTGGNEFSQLHRFDVATGEVTLLTDGKSRNSGGAWSNSGDRIVYSSTRRTGADNDFYVMNPADPSSDRLLTQVTGGGWAAADWSPDDKWILAVELVSANENHLWLVDAASGKLTPFTDRNEKQIHYSGAAFAKDGKGIWVATDRDSEFHRLAYVDLATKTPTYVTDAIKWDVDDFELSEDGASIAFVTNEAGVSGLYLLDTGSKKYKKVAGAPAGLIGSLRWHKSGRELGFSAGSARSSSDVYSLDVKGGKIVRWTASELGGINPSTLSEPELVSWKSFDGLDISGFLYKPSAKFTGKRPVMIQIHGGPEGQARPGYQGRTNYFINELGVAIIYPNVRGSSGYGKTFLKLDNGMKREDSVKDIGALLDWIKTRPDLDADRVLVTGGSYGGYMTLAVATMYNDRVRCSLDVVGISNFITFLERTESYRRDLRRVEYGDERDAAMRSFFERIAPVNNASKISKPLFVVQGKNDPRVPYTEAEQMVSTVKKNGTPVWFLMAKDEGHGFAKKANADFQFYATILFMKQYLLD